MKHAFKKTLAFLLALVMVIGVLPSVFAANVGPFTDVKDTDWFAPYVKYVYEHDPRLMEGVDTTTFAPNGTCTRAMAAVVLYRLADPVIPSVKPSTFTDLTQDWYKNGVAWAQQHGIVKGVGGNRFDPNGKVTREQLVTMMWRYAGEPEVKEDYLKNFPDANKIADYAKPAFNWAISKGIINGSDGKLLPKDNATRAQFAKIVSVFVDVTAPCTEHKWDEGKVTKEATCTEAGEKIYTCTRCGETKTEEIPATGHTYVDGVCTGCGDKLADKDEIVIYYTNDVHTYIDGALSYDNIADLKTQTEKVAAGTLLLDAGDHIQGTAYGSMDKGGKIIEMMNAAGYDAATLGNHEFDYGMERALELVGKADYPYLSANFYHEKDGVAGESVLNAYKIFEVGGKKIAVVGITTPESFTKSTPKYFQDETGKYIYGIAGGTDGAALYASVQTAVDAAKAEGVDYVIALGHCGDDPASKPWTSEEVIANTTGIDAFIDGHSHSTVEMREVKAKDGKTVVLTQTGSYFAAIGRMSITKDGIKSELITTNTGSDKTVADIKNAWIAEIDTKLGEVIGHADVTLDNYDKDGNRLVRKQETNTGDFAADALYYLFDVTNPLDVDVAIMNGGGVRNKAVTGDISYKTCKNIHTFGNVACLIEVTGQQILDALEWGAKDATPEGTKECGGFLQVSGATYEIHTYIPSTVQKDDKGVWTAGPTGEYRVKNVKINGEPLDLAKTYRLAGYNYTLRDCGDGFAMFSGAKNVLDYVMEDYMVLANYVKSFPVNAETKLPTIGTDSKYADVNGEGRIKLVNEKPDIPTPANEYVLTNELKDGDEVIIVCAAKNVALSATYNGFYNNPVAVTPADGKIADPAADIVWVVGKNGDNYTFSYGGQKLAMGDSYSSMPLGEKNDQWVLEAGKTAGTYFIKNVGREVYMEYHEEKGNWSGYYNNSAAELFEMNFYVKSAGGETSCTHEWDEGKVTTPATCTTEGVKTFTCTKCGETKTEAIPALGHIDANNDGKCDNCGTEMGTTPTNEYVLTNELKDGDEVIIVCAAKNMALAATYNGFYNNPVAVTPVDGKITEPVAEIVWVVGKNGDNYTFSYNGQKLAMGDSYSSMPLGEKNDQWVLEAGKTAGTYFIKNVGREVYMEYYESNGNWSGYYNNAVAELFEMNFYVKVESSEAVCAHAWNAGEVTTAATCTTDGVMTFTCTKCSETKTEKIAATGHVDANDDGKCDNCGADLGTADGAWVVADSIAVGDTIVITANYSGTYYAATNVISPNNAIGATAVNVVNGKLGIGEADVVWTVVAGSTDGKYLLKGSTGKYMTYSGSGTGMKLDDTGYEYELTCGEGTSVIYAGMIANSTGETERALGFRMNKDGNVPQFRMYGTANATGEYSRDITIWKPAK